MTDARQLLDHYQRNYSATPEELFFALGAVLDLHVDDAGDCRECGVDATEEPIPWPCATVRAITTALEAK